MKDSVGAFGGQRKRACVETTDEGLLHKSRFQSTEEGGWAYGVSCIVGGDVEKAGLDEAESLTRRKTCRCSHET